MRFSASQWWNDFWAEKKKERVFKIPTKGHTSPLPISSIKMRSGYSTEFTQENRWREIGTKDE